MSFYFTLKAEGRRRPIHPLVPAPQALLRVVSRNETPRGYVPFFPYKLLPPRTPMISFLPRGRLLSFREFTTANQSFPRIPPSSIYLSVNPNKVVFWSLDFCFLYYQIECLETHGFSVLFQPTRPSYLSRALFGKQGPGVPFSPFLRWVLEAKLNSSFM